MRYTEAWRLPQRGRGGSRRGDGWGDGHGLGCCIRSGLARAGGQSSCPNPQRRKVPTTFIRVGVGKGGRRSNLSGIHSPSWPSVRTRGEVGGGDTRAGRRPPPPPHRGLCAGDEVLTAVALTPRGAALSGGHRTPVGGKGPSQRQEGFGCRCCLIPQQAPSRPLRLQTAYQDALP